MGGRMTSCMKKNKPSRSKLPKGAYRLPTGGYATESKRTISGGIRIIAVHKDPEVHIYPYLSRESG